MSTGKRNIGENLSQVPAVTTALIAVNILVFLVLPSGSNLYEAGVLSVTSIADGRWWTFFSSMFLHGGLAHLLCNMVSLYYLGAMTERIFGKLRFTALYLASGLAGGLAYIGVNAALGSISGAVGASGAIFGLFGAYGYLILRERTTPVVFLYPVSRQELESYAVMLAVNLVFGLTAPNIANEAHIGGLVVGFAIAAVFYHFIAAPIRAARYPDSQQDHRG